MTTQKYQSGIDLLKKSLKEIEKTIPNFHYIYGVNFLSDMHIIKIESYDELKKDEIYKELEYSLFDIFYKEIFDQDLTITDITDKYINIDTSYSNIELDFAYHKSNPLILPEEQDEYEHSENNLLTLALAA